MRRALVAAFAAIASTVAIAAPAMAWDVIGVTRVDGRADRDVIDIDHYGRYHRLAICADRVPVRLDGIEITFGNGRQQRVDIDTILEPGSCTRAIDFRGHGRHIDSVELAFGRIGHHRRDRDDWYDPDARAWPSNWSDGYGDRWNDRRHHRRAIVKIIAE